MDYSKAKIYKIYNNVDNDIYVGSTCCPLLSQRLAKHKSQVGAKTGKIYHKGKLYPKMLELGKDNFFIELLFEYTDCQNKHQLRKKEGEYIREFQPVLNREIAGRTKQEWTKEFDEHTKDYKKEWYKNNGGKKISCPNCGIIINQSSMNRHQEKQHS